MTDKKPTHPLPNLEEIAPRVYVVRTQAGFNRLLREYKRKDKAGDDFPIETRRYPKKYPAVIKAYYEYNGYHLYSISIFTVEQYHAQLSKILEKLELHRKPKS